MPDSILSLRPYFELAYFAAGVLLLVGIVITYFQLTLIKNDIRLRNERAAKERAIEAAIRYLSEYVSKADVYYHERLEKKLDSYSGPIGDFTVQSIPAPLLRSTIKRLDSSKVHVVLNELEAIAAYFVTGVAHDETGFNIRAIFLRLS